MLYQKLLLGEKPYFVSSHKNGHGFENHRHPEVECYYCYRGGCTMIVNNTRHGLKPGDLALVGSMNAHEIQPDPATPCHALVVEVGPVFLAEHFDRLATLTRENPVLSVTEKEDPELFGLLQELIRVKESEEPFAELELRGTLYRFCAALLRRPERSKEPPNRENLRAVANIERALELIYNGYAAPITVEQVAELCGYSKSNFCRIFKQITGETFHRVLNRHRAEMACNLLKKTNHSVEEIAGEVGFADTKTFCRVFKSVTGTTAGKYRRGGL